MFTNSKFQMKSIGLVFRVTFVLSLLISILGVMPVLAISPEGNASTFPSVSPEAYLNPDGTLNLSKDFSGTFNLAGWEVKADPQKGPIFTRGVSSLGLTTPIIGNWENLGGGVPMTFNGVVRTVAVLNNGDIVVGGDFTDLGEDTRMDYIARWDGTHWLPLGDSSLNNAVYALAVDGNGNLYVGGMFTNVNNNSTAIGEADYIVKWDGTDWSALSSNGAGGGSLNNGVKALKVAGNGNLYVGGWFTGIYNGSNFINSPYFGVWSISASTWNSLADSSLSQQGAANNDILTAITDGNGNLYVGGSFFNLNGVDAADYVAKWDGIAWSALGSNGLGNGSLSGRVKALAIDGNGNLYAGGGFSNVNNLGTVLGEADYVAKWNGTDWSALGSNGVGNGSLNNSVNALAIDENGNLYVGGWFTNVNNNGTVLSAGDYIAKWDGTSWSALGSNGAGDGPLNSPYSTVWALAVDGSGNLYVGGQFDNAGGNGAADNIAKWDGTNWLALGSNGVGDGALTYNNTF